MGFQVPGLVAARVLAHAVVPDHQGPPLRCADQSLGAPEGEHTAMLVHHGTEHRIVAGQPLGGSRLDRTHILDLADGCSRLGRSRGNVSDASPISGLGFDGSAMVGIRRNALAIRTCSRATPGAIAHDHDSQ
jgi:hypothetical protein